MPTDTEVADFLRRNKLLRQGESPWPSFNPQESERYRVSWDVLFPSRRRTTRDGNYEWDFDEDEWQLDVEGDFGRGLEGALAAPPPTEGEIRGMAATNRWDTCAWYQPVHSYGADWGIFIRQDCLLDQACRIARLVPKPVSPSLGLARALIRASTYSLFLHEQYHHKVESLGIRLEVVELRDIYASYSRLVYGSATGTDKQLEEALANASSYRRLPTDPYERWISPPIVKATRNYLKATFPYELPGYRQAALYLDPFRLERGENLLHSRVHEGTQTPSQPGSDWIIATRWIQSLFKVTDNIWAVVTPGGRRILPGHPWP